MQMARGLCTVLVCLIRIKIPLLAQLLVSLAIVFSFTSLSFAQEIQFSSQTTTIEAGGSTTLNWSVKNAVKVYLSTIGVVPTEGSQEISPDKTTKYTLIAEGSNGVTSRVLEINVTGARGGDYPMDLTSFRYPITAKRKAPSYVEFLDQVRRVLQDEMHLSVYGPFPAPSGNFQFITSYKRIGAEPCEPNEVNVGERTISFLVEVEKVPLANLESKSAKLKKGPAPGQDFSYTIKAYYQFRKKIERTMRSGDCGEIFKSETEGLKAKIESLVN